MIAPASTPGEPGEGGGEDQVQRITREVSMPEVSARSRLSESARIRLPSSV